MDNQDRDVEAGEADPSNPSAAMSLEDTSESALFSSFKAHTAELVGMGFPVARTQRALFWAIEQGVELEEQFDVALDLLLERGDELDTEEFDTNASTLAAQSFAVTGPAPEDEEAERRAAARAHFAARPARPAPRSRDRISPGSPAIRSRQPRASANGAAAADDVTKTDAESRLCGICWDVLLPEDSDTTGRNLEEGNEVSKSETSPVATNNDDDDESGRVAVQLGACGHMVCRECAAGWLHANIIDGKLELRCPLASQCLPGTSPCQTPAPPLAPPAVETLIWASCRFLTPPFKGKVPSVSLQIAQAQQAMQQAEGSPEVAAAAGAALLALSRFDGSGTSGSEGRSRRPELLNKYRRFRLQQALEGHSDIMWCSALGCGAPLVKRKYNTSGKGFGLSWWSQSSHNDSNNNDSSSSNGNSNSGGRRLTCGACGHVACGDCGRAYHGAAPLFGVFTWGSDAHGTSCDQATDEVLAEFAARKHLQPCPSCRRPVEKVDACPHMTCPCGHQWCWVCRGAHPCGGLHFGVDGSGSGEEIGSVWGVQRAAVVARSLSAASFPCFALLVLGIGAAVWSLSAALFLLFIVSNLVAAVVSGCRIKPTCPVDCDPDCSSEANQACCYFVWAPCITASAFLAPFVALAILYATSGPFTLLAVVFLLVEAFLVLWRWMAALCYRCGCRQTSRCLRGLPQRRYLRHRRPSCWFSKSKPVSFAKGSALASTVEAGATTSQPSPLQQSPQTFDFLETPLLENNDDETMQHHRVNPEEKSFGLATDTEGRSIRDLYLLPSQLHGKSNVSTELKSSCCCCRGSSHRYFTSYSSEDTGNDAGQEDDADDDAIAPLWCPLELSALNLNFNPMSGPPDAEEDPFMSDSEKYRGVLPSMFWRTGRVALAGCVAAWLFLPSVAIGCVCLPFGPMLPLPLILNPRGRPPPRLTAMLSCLGAIVATLIVWACASWYSSRAQYSSSSESGALGLLDTFIAMLNISSNSSSSSSGSSDGSSSVDLKEQVAAFAVVFVLSLLACSAWCFRAPSSTCTCCAPLWHGALSLPLTFLLGRREAKMQANAFGPTPDLPLQLPLMVCYELASGDCLSFSD